MEAVAAQKADQANADAAKDEVKESAKKEDEVAEWQENFGKLSTTKNHSGWQVPVRSIIINL